MVRTSLIDHFGAPTVNRYSPAPNRQKMKIRLKSHQKIDNKQNGAEKGACAAGAMGTAAWPLRGRQPGHSWGYVSAPKQGQKWLQKGQKEVKSNQKP